MRASGEKKSLRAENERRGLGKRRRETFACIRQPAGKKRRKERRGERANERESRGAISRLEKEEEKDEKGQKYELGPHHSFYSLSKSASCGLCFIPRKQLK